MTDTALLPTDVSMPQLKTLWNAVAMRSVFHDALTPAGQKAFEIRDCRLSRFRYRKGVRSIVLYELDLFETATGLNTVRWIVGTTYPEGKTKRVFKRFNSDLFSSELTAACAPFAPVLFIPNIEMLVQTFPFDRYLHTLPALITTRPAALQSVFLRQFGPGAWRIEHWNAEPARYRPLLGVTLRYTITARDADSGMEQTQRFFAKAYRDEDGCRAHEFLREIETSFSGNARSFSMVEPVAYLRSLNALILKEASGESLEQLLIEGGDLVETACRTAQALAAFHLSKAELPRIRSRDYMIANIRKKADFIAWACPDLRAGIRTIIDAVETGLEDVPPCPTHMDIKPDHIFINADRVALIDVDSMAGADPVYDPATLLARLQAMPYLSNVTRTTVETFADQFIDEYFSCVPDLWRKRLPLMYACAAVKTALYFVQHQEPRWSEKAAFLIQKAGEAVAGEAVS